MPELLRKVKPSDQIDLAYLYYLPFCAVFSSRDNFHVQVAPLFLRPTQQFVHGDALKADLKKLNEKTWHSRKKSATEAFWDSRPVLRTIRNV